MIRKILVIDDDIAIHKILVKNLSDSNTEISTACTGEIGIAMAMEYLPDLILLDVNMPGLNGHEVCRRLQADKMTRAIPVAFLTASSTTLEKVKGLDHGAIDYIPKPFDLLEVGARIRAAFRTTSTFERLAASSLVDKQTGLSGRAAFEQRLTSELARARRSAMPLGCLVIEPDHMERVAINEGFAACDKIISEIAIVLQEGCREEDALFRYADRQFAILAPNVTRENAPKLGERLQWCIESHAASWRDFESPVTISVGIAIALFSFGRSVACEAEIALNQALNEGGDSVVTRDGLADLRLAA